MNDEKSEIPISKFETISKSKIPMFKTAGALVPPRRRPVLNAVLWSLGFVSHFEFCLILLPSTDILLIGDQQW